MQSTKTLSHTVNKPQPHTHTKISAYRASQTTATEAWGVSKWKWVNAQTQTVTSTDGWLEASDWVKCEWSDWIIDRIQWRQTARVRPETSHHYCVRQHAIRVNTGQHWRREWETKPDDIFWLKKKKKWFFWWTKRVWLQLGQRQLPLNMALGKQFSKETSSRS